jgi:hypothetical protein
VVSCPSGLEPLRYLNADVVMCEVLEKASFEVIKTLTETLPDTVPDLGFNVDENGWKVSLPLYIVTTKQKSNADYWLCFRPSSRLAYPR